MSYVIEFAGARAQPFSMTWEEDTLVERLIRMLRERFSPVARLDVGRARSARLRYFIASWAASHWSERV